MPYRKYAPIPSLKRRERKACKERFNLDTRVMMGGMKAVGGSLES
jgi:hypothetical protein